MARPSPDPLGPRRRAVRVVAGVRQERYASSRLADHLQDAGIVFFIGSVGGAHGNALTT
ncbi:hypothetical protein ACE14D_10270 [Streptomyces sp. Act-28]